MYVWVLSDIPKITLSDEVQSSDDFIIGSKDYIYHEQAIKEFIKRVKKRVNEPHNEKVIVIVSICIQSC